MLVLCGATFVTGVVFARPDRVHSQVLQLGGRFLSKAGIYDPWETACALVESGHNDPATIMPLLKDGLTNNNGRTSSAMAVLRLYINLNGQVVKRVNLRETIEYGWSSVINLADARIEPSDMAAMCDLCDPSADPDLANLVISIERGTRDPNDKIALLEAIQSECSAADFLYTNVELIQHLKRSN